MDESLIGTHGRARLFFLDAVRANNFFKNEFTQRLVFQCCCLCLVCDALKHSRMLDAVERQMKSKSTMEFRKRRKKWVKIPSGNHESEIKIHRRRIGQLRRLVGKKWSAGHGNIFLLFVIIVICMLFSIYVLFRYLNGSDSKQYLKYISSNRVLHQKVPDITPSTSSTVEAILLPGRPRTIGYYFETAHSDQSMLTVRLDPNVLIQYHSHARKAMTKKEWRRQEDLMDSEDYKYGKPDKFENGDCLAQYEWQKSSFPTSNLLMEVDLTDLGLNANGEESLRLIANGYWRDVWKVVDPAGTPVVLKTIRYEHDYEERNYDRHRRDAVAMERLTSSPYVMDIYAFDGNSGLCEFGDGGSIEDQIWYIDDTSEDWTSSERLVIAHQLASGLADTHNVGNEGVPAIAHADMTTSQYVYVKESGIYKLNDFNRCRFLAIDKKTNEICPYHVGNNPGTFRSPEEYAYEPQTEKVDVYSLGNIFYGILTGEWPFHHESSEKKAQKRLIAGERPSIADKHRNSSDPFDQAMIKAIEMCWIQKPEERANARQVQKFIKEVLRQQGVSPNQRV